MNEEVNWDQATNGESTYIRLEESRPKTLVIKNWKLVKTIKNFSGEEEEKVEFCSEVTAEDGKPCDPPKQFNTVSNRLKMKLREKLEGKDPSKELTITVLKVGSSYNSQYAVNL